MPASTTRASAVRGAFLEHVGAALAALDRVPYARGDTIHIARKAIRLARAVLRLLRPALGERRFRAQNAALRDAGRMLSRMRDATVVERTLRRFTAARATASPAYAPLAAALRRERDSAAAALRAGTARRSIRRALLAARRSVAAAPPPDARSLAAGLRRLYRRARRAGVVAREHATAEALHEWRKGVKTHEGALKALVGARRKRRERADLRRLARLLGDDRDAAALADRARDGELSPAALDRLLETIGRDRKRLEHRAFALGDRLYGQRPRAYVRRVLPRGVARGSR